MLREWIFAHPEDRELYRRAKIAAAKETTCRPGIVTDYNQHKEPVIRKIYERMFRAHGLLHERRMVLGRMPSEEAVGIPSCGGPGVLRHEFFVSALMCDLLSPRRGPD
jgi:hypothetical protein